MRRSIMFALATIAGAATSGIIAAAPAHAQMSMCEEVTAQPPMSFSDDDAASFRSITRGRAVTDRLTDDDRMSWDTRSSVCDDEAFYHVYAVQVEAGQGIAVVAEASFTPMLAIYERGELLPGYSAESWVRRYHSDVTGFSAYQVRTFTAREAGTMLVAITSREGRGTGRYHLCVSTVYSDGVYPCDKVEPTSSIRGVHVSPAFVGTWMSTEGVEQRHSTIGWGGRVGIGLGRVVLFGEYRDEIADDNAEGGAEWDGLYGMKSYDGGLRVYLGSDYGTIRPYVQGSYGVREREAESGPDRLRGRAWGGGAGLEMFLGRVFTFDFGGTAGRTTFNELSTDGADWADMDPVQWSDLRASVGVSVNLSGLIMVLNDS